LKNKKFISLAIGIILITFVVIAFIFLFKGKNTVKPKVGSIVEAIYALGTVKSDNIYILKMGVTSGVRELYVTEGDSVKKGQKLISTESTSLTSPIDGTVSKIYLDKGETIMPGVPVLTVMDLSKTFLQISLDQTSALRIRKGQKAELSFENLRGTKLNGIVTRIYPSDGQFLVRVETENLPEGILPGMTADTAIEIATRENAILIPANSIHRGTVQILRNNKSIRLEVKIGAVNGEWAEILENKILSEDEIILSK
jgi:multidrug efflux pump subunit AcrA (membrane-fusion protein)